MIKERNLEHKQGRKLWENKYIVNTIHFPSFEFLKLDFLVERKIITLYDVTLGLYRGNS